MENKTDKPYSLQDAKESISKINGFNDWSYLRSKYSKDGIETTMAEAAELYASKATEETQELLKKAISEMDLAIDQYNKSVEATEELRKEMDGLIEIHHLQSQELLSEIERLKESNKQMKEIFNMIKPQLVKHGFKGTTEEIEKFIQKSECDLLKVIIDKSKELDAEQKSHTVTNTDQLRINAMGKSEGDVNKKIWRQETKTI